MTLARKTRGKSARTLRTEAAIFQVVEERAPLTVRGVCYALFTLGLIPSMARAAGSWTPWMRTTCASALKSKFGLVRAGAGGAQ